METKTQSARANYVRVPAMFLQAGFPLKITLYQYAPASTGLKVLHRKGEMLDLASFLELKVSADTLILVLQNELKALLAQSAAEWASMDQMAA